MKGQSTPFACIQTGYEIGVNAMKGGFMMNPSIGFKTFVSKINSFNISLGYKWQQTIIDYDVWISNTPLRIDHLQKSVFYNFITLNMGYSF